MNYLDVLKYPSEVRTKWNEFDLTNLPFKIVDFEKGLISNVMEKNQIAKSRPKSLSKGERLTTTTMGKERTF